MIGGCFQQIVTQKLAEYGFVSKHNYKLSAILCENYLLCRAQAICHADAADTLSESDALLKSRQKNEAMTRPQLLMTQDDTF